MRFLPLFMLMLWACCLMAQNNEVEITAEPAHRQVLANPQVRAFYVEVPPHGQTLMHRHRHDYVVVSLDDSDIENAVSGKDPQKLKMRAGEVRFVDGNFAHIARNLSDKPFRNVTVELLQDDKAKNSPAPHWDEERGVDILQGGTRDVLFVKDGARVSELELQPGGVVPQHAHKGPHLVIAVTDLDLLSRRAGQTAAAPQKTQLKSGEVAWVSGNITHTVTNVAKSPAKLVIIEFP